MAGFMAKATLCLFLKTLKTTYDTTIYPYKNLLQCYLDKDVSNQARNIISDPEKIARLVNFAKDNVESRPLFILHRTTYTA